MPSHFATDDIEMFARKAVFSTHGRAGDGDSCGGGADGGLAGPVYYGGGPYYYGGYGYGGAPYYRGHPLASW